MAFPRYGQRTPTTIEHVTIILRSDKDKDTGVVTTRFDAVLTVLDQNGELLTQRTLDLTPHLTAQQLSQCQTFIAAMRTKAETEVLG